jgi:hypothetical protein
MNNNFLKMAVAGLVLGVSGFANATLINDADIVINGNTYTTFLNDSTGDIWLDIDSFFGDTAGDVGSFLSGYDYTLGTAADVDNLLNPLIGVQSFDSMFDVVNDSGAGRTNLIWGLDAFASSYSWLFSHSSAVQHYDGYSGGTYEEMGHWVIVGTNAFVGTNAIVGTNAVPEPSILALVGLGIFGLGISRRKMKK